MPILQRNEDLLKLLLNSFLTSTLLLLLYSQFVQHYLKNHEEFEKTRLQSDFDGNGTKYFNFTFSHIIGEAGGNSKSW